MFDCLTLQFLAYIYSYLNSWRVVSLEKLFGISIISFNSMRLNVFPFLFLCLAKDILSTKLSLPFKFGLIFALQLFKSHISTCGSRLYGDNFDSYTLCLAWSGKTCLLEWHIYWVNITHKVSHLFHNGYFLARWFFISHVCVCCWTSSPRETYKSLNLFNHNGVQGFVVANA